MARLSIIIPHYNTLPDLLDCLRSIYESSSARDLEVLVIDNKSADQSALRRTLLTCFPKVKVVLNEKNLGFAAANNVGLRMATGENLLLLNPDTVLKDNALADLEAFLRGKDDAGMVGPLILDDKGSVQFYCARTFPDIITEIFHHSGIERLFPRSTFFGKYLMTYWKHDTIREVDLIQGSCMMVKRSALNSVGLMDERFFLFADDVEWCYRFKRKGLKVYFIPTAKIVHKGGTSARGRKSLTFVIGLDSLFRFFNIHYSTGAGILYRVSIFYIYFGKILFCWIHNLHNFPLYLRVVLWSVGLLKFARTDSGNPYLRIA